jgi:hypothetical protein
MSIPVILVILTAGWLNQTRISVDDRFIEITNFPLPFPARRIIEADDIINIYARNNLVPNRLIQKNFCGIHALNDRGEQKKLLGFMINIKQAELISGKLKKIVCMKTPGSISGTEMNGILNV